MSISLITNTAYYQVGEVNGSAEARFVVEALKKVFLPMLIKK